MRDQSTRKPPHGLRVFCSIFLLDKSVPNEPSVAKRRGIVEQILAMFTNPLVLIPLIASLATGSDKAPDAVSGRLRM